MDFDLIAQGQQFQTFRCFPVFSAAKAHLDLCGRQKAHSEVLGHLFSPSEKPNGSKDLVSNCVQDMGGVSHL